MASVNISFEYHESGEKFFVDHPLIEGVYYGTEASVKKSMRKAIADQIDDALTLRNRIWEERRIGCVDGTVFHVRFKYSWCYEILGPGRSGASSCCGFDDFKDTLEHARKHAETFGGIAWEC